MNIVAVAVLIVVLHDVTTAADVSPSCMATGQLPVLPTECPSGYIYLSSAGGCYKAVSEPLPWSEARANCQKTPGASLASITSKNIDDAMLKFIKSLSPTQTENCAHFMWTSGQRTRPGDCSTPLAWSPSDGVRIPFTYTRYDTIQPDCWQPPGHTKESCHAYYITDPSPWNDLSCELPRCSLCSWSQTSQGLKSTNLVLDADNVINSLNFDQTPSLTDVAVPNSKLPNRADYKLTDTVFMPAETQIIAVSLTNENGNGPAGFIASSTDGRVITNKSWKCSTTVTAGWGRLNYDDSKWQRATEVEQNGGITWGRRNDISSSAYWIWTNNTAKDLNIFCRCRLIPIDIVLTADSVLNAMYVDGRQVSSDQLPNAADVRKTDTVSVSTTTKLIAVKLTSVNCRRGFLASSADNTFITNKSWKCTNSLAAGWETTTFDDSQWPQATEVDLNGGTWDKYFEISSSAWWIWTRDSADLIVYCRFHI